MPLPYPRPRMAGDMSRYLIHTVGCDGWQLLAPFPQPSEALTGQLAQEWLWAARPALSVLRGVCHGFPMSLSLPCDLIK